MLLAITAGMKEAPVENTELERRAKKLWEQENPGKPWQPIAHRLEPGQDLSTGATEEDRERYRQRVRDGE
jgi:hypothetical protein